MHQRFQGSSPDSFILLTTQTDMRYSFFSLVLLWLTACTTIPYSHIPSTAYFTSRDVEAHDIHRERIVLPLSHPSFIKVVGFYDGLAIVKIKGYRYTIPSDALEAIEHNDSFTDGPSGIGTSNHELYTGPRGGQYYINGNGNRTYITPQSTINAYPMQTGPRGGQYYINGNGNKSYIKK